MIAEDIPKKRLVPVAAAFAAVYATLRLVPISVIIGGSGRVFSTTEFIAPILGIVLGPYTGSLAALVGTFLGIMLTGRMNFFGLDFIPSMMNALVLGFLMRRRSLISILLYSALLALFFAHPSTLHFISVPFLTGKIEVPYVWLHIIVWILLVSPLSRRSVEWMLKGTGSKAVGAACVLTLIGTTAQQLAGTLLYASMAVPLMGLSPQALEAVWIAAFYTYPIERLIIVLPAASLVTVAVVKALKATGLFSTMGGMAQLHDRRQGEKKDEQA